MGLVVAIAIAVILAVVLVLALRRGEKPRPQEEIALSEAPRAVSPSGAKAAVTRRSPFFAAIDFETANSASDSACAIGVAVVEGGEVTHTFERLIKPPTDEFSEWNFRIHGIEWSQVRGKPDFGAVWTEIHRELADAEFLVAHNAGFDQRILEACCDRYGLDLPRQGFVCTVEVASAMWPLASYSLDRVSQYLQIPLQHHRAGSDAEASARILLRAIADGYSLAHPRSSPPSEWGSKHLSAEINAVVSAIMEDGRVDPHEVYALSQWLATHGQARGVWPGCELSKLTSAALSDGSLNERELGEIRGLCVAILGIKERAKARRRGAKKSSEVAVCFTGFGGKKDALEEEAEAAGFRVAGSVIKNLDMLVTGPMAGPSKLKQAQERGVRVVSLDEWRAVIAKRRETMEEQVAG